MTDPTFTEGQRVYHRQRKQLSTYVRQVPGSDESVITFDELDDPRRATFRVTTAQLVAADEIEGNA